MLWITLIAGLVLLLWNIPEARHYTALSLPTAAEVIEPNDIVKSLKDWFNSILS